MTTKIHCPNCDRILGDTEKPLDGVRFNCRGCKQTVDIKLKLAEHDDFYSKIILKEKNK